MSKSDVVEEVLQRVVKTGKISNEDISKLMREAKDHPEWLDAINATLRKIGAHEVGSGAPLNAADYYVDGAEKFRLMYELQLPMQLPVPFEDLDRKTQFCVLFMEWSRRELEGMMVLNSGDVALADSVFQECENRAKQLGVVELLARSYEGRMRCAQRLNNPTEERKWLRAAHNLRVDPQNVLVSNGD